VYNAEASEPWVAKQESPTGKANLRAEYPKQFSAVFFFGQEFVNRIFFWQRKDKKPFKRSHEDRGHVFLSNCPRLEEPSTLGRSSFPNFVIP
jgi:hypothetical protein